MAVTITKTVKSAGGDYTSLSAWEAGQQGDLVTLDEIHQAECYNFSDTTAVTFAGWTTDATRYLRVYTPAAERHTGVFGTGYRLIASAAFGNTILVSAGADHARFEGLIVEANGNVGVPLNIGSTSGEKQISLCLFRGSTTPDYGISLPNDFGTVKIWNCVVGTNFDKGIWMAFGNAGSTLVLYNNTVLGNRTNGIIVAGNHTHYLKNNCVQGTATNYTVSTVTSATNLSEDTTSPEVALRSKVVSFVDEANNDLHLASDDTSAKDAGTDLSGDAQLAFSDDIDGAARVAPWDIGADETAAGGGVVTPRLLGLLGAGA